MSGKKTLSLLVIVITLLSVVVACAPKVIEKVVKETVIVEKVVEKPVEKVVKETVIVAGTPKVVERVVTVAPAYVGPRKKVYFASGEPDPGQVELFEALELEYEALHPDIDIVYERVIGDCGVLLSAAMAAGVPKGVYDLPSGDVLGLWDKDVFLPLDDVVDDLGRDELYPWAKMTMPDGNDYAIAHSGSMLCMWTRRDLLAEEGLEIPKTHAELIEAAKRLTKDTDGDGVIDQYGIAIPGSEHPATNFVGMQFLWQNGCQIFDKDLNITLGEPGCIKAIEEYAELLNYGPPAARTYEWKQHRENYRTGKVAIILAWARILMTIGIEQPDLAAVTDVSQVPYDKVRVNTGGADYYVIAKTCTHVEETKEFLKWLLTGDRALRFLSSAPGHLQPNSKSLSEAFLDFVPDDPKIAGYMKEHRDWLETIFTEVAPYSLDIWSQEGSIQDDKVVFTNVALPSELAARVYSAPPLLSEVIVKVAWEGWTAEDAVAWGIEELEKVKAEME